MFNFEKICMTNNIKIDGLSVFYRDSDGANNNTASDEFIKENILILHGWGSNSSRWIKVQKQLTQNGYRVVMPDLPGFGNTKEPPSAWTISDYSNFVHEFTKKINLDKFVLIGHSFGGRIAIDYTIRYTEQLNKLVLISAAGITRHKRVKTRVFLILTKLSKIIFSISILEYFRPFAIKIVYKFTGSYDYKKASQRMQKIMKRILEENLRAFLPRIILPTLILWGEKDTLTPVSDGEILNEEIQNSYLHIFPNQPHALNITMPKTLAKYIANFIKAKKPRS